VRQAVLFAALLVAVEGRAACRCPLSAFHTNLLITAPAEGRGGVVVCGIEESRKGKVILGSEIQLFRCDDSKELFYFDGTQKVTIEPVRGALRLVEYSDWPFGKGWKWIEVPVAEWLVDSASADSVAHPRLPKPQATKDEIRKFLRNYRAWIAAPDLHHEDGEEMVGRIFAAAVTGDAEAYRLFLSMRTDAPIDGAASEDYETAQYHYRVGRNPQTK
jgi:hypothetical protein